MTTTPTLSFDAALAAQEAFIDNAIARNEPNVTDLGFQGKGENRVRVYQVGMPDGRTVKVSRA